MKTYFLKTPVIITFLLLSFFSLSQELNQELAMNKFSSGKYLMWRIGNGTNFNCIKGLKIYISSTDSSSSKEFLFEVT